MPAASSLEASPPPRGAVSARERRLIMHRLWREERLHEMRVNRLFFRSVIDARATRAVAATRQFLGLTQSLQGRYEAPHHFVLLQVRIYIDSTSN